MSQSLREHRGAEVQLMPWLHLLGIMQSRPCQPTWKVMPGHTLLLRRSTMTMQIRGGSEGGKSMQWRMKGNQQQCFTRVRVNGDAHLDRQVLPMMQLVLLVKLRPSMETHLEAER
jgi:hypothetical protein